MRINKKIIVILITFVVIAAVLMLVKRESKNNDYDKPGYTILDNYAKDVDEYYKECPFDEISLDANNKGYEVLSVKCSANQDPEFSTNQQGEDVVIAIHTYNLETGRSEFTRWLKEQGLEESPTLRITYQHQPDTN